MSGSLDLEKVVYTAEVVVRSLDAAMEILQAAQATIPAPTLEEVAEIRMGKRRLTPEAYLLGLYQRAIVGAENLASDLRFDFETLESVHEVQLSMVELNAIDEAVVERLRGAEKEP